ncbi:hypothetical protein ACQPW1_44700 [Nocardia sp. CA-128927]|uniref:hypothetical protein n=1 Tax=Nocardia sp. CA-128927 TaxID=3239975 RepID=UPI003D96E341
MLQRVWPAGHRRVTGSLSAHSGMRGHLVRRGVVGNTWFVVATLMKGMVEEMKVYNNDLEETYQIVKQIEEEAKADTESDVEALRGKESSS